MDWLNSVLVSVGTALITTLVIEYFAKPRLEARKEAHLEMLRERRALVAKIRDMTLAAIMNKDPIVGDFSAPVRNRLEREAGRQYERMCKMALELVDEMGAHMGAYPTRWHRPLIGAYIHVVYGVALSDRNRRRQAEIIADLSPLAVEWLERGRLWRIPIAARAGFRLERRIEEIHAESDSSNIPHEPAAHTSS